MQKTLAKADSFLPAFDYENDAKRRYLSYRLSGFSRAEALRYADVKRITLYKWKQNDEEFEAIDGKSLVELSAEFRREIISMEYTRNFRLALAKDEKILKKSMDSTAKLSDDEWDYLKKIRPLYSPQALKALESLYSDKSDTPDSWDELLIIARRSARYVEKEEVEEATVIDNPKRRSFTEFIEGEDST